MLKAFACWLLCVLCLCLSTAAAQSQPVWDSGNVQSAEGPATHDLPLPQLRVKTADWWEYALDYQVFPDPAQVKDARIEVWDGPALVFRQAVAVNTAGGKLLWDNSIDVAPNKLQIALLDPDFKPKRICIDYCNPEDLTQLLPTSELVVGVGPDGDPPYPELQIQAVRTVAGASGLEAVIAGIYLAPDSRLLLSEYDPENRTYNHLQFLPFDYLDLYHVKVSLPAALLQHARILVLNAMPPPPELSIPGDSEPTFDGTPKQWMPGTSVYYSAAVVVACEASAEVDRLEPAAVRADAGEVRVLSGDTAAGQSFPPERGTYLHVLGKNFNPDSRITVGDPLRGQAFETEFISPTELRFWLESEKLKAAVGYTITVWVVNQKESCAISNAGTFRVLPTDEIPEPVPAGDITITEPYPVPLMNQDGPPEMEIVVRGKNFRPNVTVVAWSDYQKPKKLKTSFISSQELRALLPREMWRIHRPSFCFVITTAAGEQAVKIAEPEHSLLP